MLLPWWWLLFLADGSWLLVGANIVALAFFGSARAPADPNACTASEFSDKKTGADLEVLGSSLTFLAAMVLD